ncbi:TetR/AcrR family transcriptional regulator [Nocardioides sp. CBS4Y-1]|uniref:TetR/AcrR family transcriptional regulator n=2 Tax=Nocardioides acrostichi TaxID=2784339 RepID=A0A930Y7P3_9ACTN|nr:TetR/AcrR family transcriptional regulator [Nocardioides acrostichi]
MRESVIAAAGELLREGGARAVTTRAVADRAGVQAPTIYRLFGDKDGLLDALAEEAVIALLEAKQGSRAAPSEDGDPSDPVEALRAAWRSHVAFGLANPDLYVLMSQPRPGGPSPAMLRGIEQLQGHIRACAVAGRLAVSERRATEIIHAAGHGVVLALIGQVATQRDLALSDTMLEGVISMVVTDTPGSHAHAPAGALSALVHVHTMVDELDPLSRAERSLLAEWLARSIDHLQ